MRLKVNRGATLGIDYARLTQDWDNMKRDKIVKRSDINKWGLELLGIVTPHNSDLSSWKHILEMYKPLENLNDDVYIWLTLILALQAADIGNFGVGSVLVDGNGDVVATGHNKVFEPYFRSDLHAEMVVMNQFEDESKDVTNLENYTVYTSFESCPMCLARLITSSVGTILHAAPDKDGGMVHKIMDLPPIWRSLSKRQVFNQAKCSKTMISIAANIINYSVNQLNNRLEQR